MCQPCCIVCGCTDIDVNIDCPAGYPLPPRQIFCPRCNNKTSTCYRKEFTMCSICFIPIPCCPCGSSAPFLACSTCNFPLGSHRYKECESCGVSGIENAEFCANCGSRSFKRNNEYSNSEGHYRPMGYKQNNSSHTNTN